MSLFEDSSYDHRDTFFIHFDIEDRPTGDQVRKAIASLGDKYEMSALRETDGLFESLCIKSPHDSSAMDITFVQGEEVSEQIKSLMNEFKTITLAGDDHKKLKLLSEATARFDIYHFEQTMGGENEMLDPSGLFLVMEKLINVCKGVGHDPQSNTLI